MTKLLSLFLNLWRNHKKKIVSIPFIAFVLFYATCKGNITTSEFITYYTFMIGFHMQSYISINMTPKAEKLKKNDSFDSIISIYKKTIMSNVIGLIITICTVLSCNEWIIKINSDINLDIFKLIEIAPFAFSTYYLIVLIDSLIKFFKYMEKCDSD